MIVKMRKNLGNRMEKMQELINKDLEKLKNKHTETNNTITEIKNTLEGINKRISEAKECISEKEDKILKITSEEQNKVKKKKMKRTEDSVRDLWDNIKCTNIQIIGVLEREEKKTKGTRKILKRLYMKISPSWKRKYSIKSKRHKETHKPKEIHANMHTNQTNKD